MKNRTQILAMENGRFLVEAFEALEDDMQRAPVSIGAATVRVGRGTPNGTVIGATGDLYLRLDGGGSATFYVKESTPVGSPTLGWVAK